MNKPNFTKLIRTVQTFTTKHSPEILVGLGITGMVSSTVLAVRATPKAVRLIEAKKEELQVDKLKPVDTVKACWKCYIPAVVTGVSGMACVIGSTSVSVRRHAALATAYSLSETALTEYKEKVIETIGEKKEQIVREKIAEDRLEKNPVTNSEVIITGKGETLCYDHLSGRYFKSDIEKIKRVVNELNHDMINDMGYVSLNEFYDRLDLEPTELGYTLGWSIDMNREGFIDVNFSAKVAADGTPCIVVEYVNAPKYGFDQLEF